MNMLVSDYDGTFSTTNEDIKLNCKVLEKYIARGNIFVLSSGRSFDSLKNQVYFHNIPYSYLATSDGNYLFDNKDNLIMKKTISHDIVDKLDKLKSIKVYDKIDYTYERMYCEIYVPELELGSIGVVLKNDKINQEFIDEYNRLKMENSEYQFSIYGYHDTLFYMIRPLGVNKSTPINNRKCKEFSDYYDMIWKEIDKHA